MSPITGTSEASHHFGLGDFQSESPLRPEASSLLHTFFEQGWADPSKIHQRSAQLRILIESAKEEIASHLGVKKNELEFVGELGFGFWTAISGLIEPSRELVHSVIDRQIVHAFARRHRDHGGKVTEVNVDTEGRFQFPAQATSVARTLIWQATNRESGVIQSRPQIEDKDSLFADMTATSPLASLPENWSVALWDPRNFAGPQGIAILAIREGSSWRNPLPPIDNRRTFGSFSKPLLLATAISLSSYIADLKAAQDSLRANYRALTEHLRAKIPGVSLVADDVEVDCRYLACAIPDVIAEEILRSMETKGFLIDAGSACGAGALSPSHVLDAMGWAGRAHFRFSLRTTHQSSDIANLASNFAAAIAEARSE